MKTKNLILIVISILALYGWQTFAAQWKDLDTNCQKNDVAFFYNGLKYTWAGCNSTLGGGAGVAVTFADYDHRDPAVYKCNGVAETDPKFLTTTGIELQMGGSCKIDNIFGKMYRSYRAGAGVYNSCKNTAITGTNNFIGSNNTNCPCPNGWHVPTLRERQIAKEYYGPLDGWAGATTGMVMSMGLPLAGLIHRESRIGNMTEARGGPNSSYTISTLFGGVVGTCNVYGTSTSCAAGGGGNDAANAVRCIKDTTWGLAPYLLSKSFVKTNGVYIGTTGIDFSVIKSEMFTPLLQNISVKLDNPSDSTYSITFQPNTKFVTNIGNNDFTGTMPAPSSVDVSTISNISGNPTLYGAIKFGNLTNTHLINTGGNVINATITIPVSSSLNGKNLKIYYSNNLGSSWSILRSVAVNNGTVSFQINSLARFAAGDGLFGYGQYLSGHQYDTWNSFSIPKVAIQKMLIERGNDTTKTYSKDLLNKLGMIKKTDIAPSDSGQVIMNLKPFKDFPGYWKVQ